MQPARFLAIFLALGLLAGPGNTALAKSDVTQGRLDAFGSKGESLGSCPLKHTDVKVDIAGFIARVTVKQQFHNPFKDKIEAVYVFPLSQDAAVDRMTMTVGDRVIKGEIRERSEARAIYETAKAQGKVASLLDQERPNIFTQSVANIEPGEQVDIEISYSETLEWKDGEYKFDFPMVVGPRYIPGGGSASGEKGDGPLLPERPGGGFAQKGSVPFFAPPTPQVPDADRITPPVTPEGTRAGHDVSLAVELNAGLPVRRLDSKQHAVDVSFADAEKTTATVKLAARKTIPNKDFVLVYETATDRIEDTVLTHTDERGKFFTLVLQPPKRVRRELIVPKELVFVIDKSGSMRGFPIETAKKAMRLCIEGLHTNDTFNLMTFAGGVGFCFEKPVPNTDENRRRALAYLESLQGSGGTEMMKAIHACLGKGDSPPEAKGTVPFSERVRVVCFMTDGYVGNDMAIIDAVKENAETARVFSFGIGTSVNRFLLDGIARAGRGEVHYILNQQQATGAAERFYERVRTPVLTDVELRFDGVEVTELYPPQIPDLFAAKPVVVKGQYKSGGRGVITLKGNTGEGPFERKIDVTFPAERAEDEVLAPLWARAKVEHLMGKDLTGIQRGQPDPAVKEEILGLGLRFDLLTQFTSFVAVEHVKITTGGQPRLVPVPVEMPEGVDYEGVFGPGPGPGAHLPLYGMAGSPDMFSTGPSNVGGASYGYGSAGGVVARAGGTQASENTVATALGWLAANQLADGSWSFRHGGAAGDYANPGTWPSTTGATGLALLPFLGAGQTHKDGKYKATVYRGLKYLVGQMEVTRKGGDLRGESTAYVWQGIAAIALCEAYAMTHDKALAEPAQRAIDFIAATQDAKTGAWPSKPGRRPDTVVAAWQIMALKSAHMAYLKVPEETVKRADEYLARAAVDDGAKYGRHGPHHVDDTATAAALLCRLHLGRKNALTGSVLGSGNLPLARPDREPPATPLARGVKHLSGSGPAEHHAMENYFITLLLHQTEGEPWKQWNQEIRNRLVNAQAGDGPEKGSWFDPNDPRATNGGRLWQTALAVMTLEVYYRHLPIYRKAAGEPW